jgi:hypothetical protein
MKTHYTLFWLLAAFLPAASFAQRVVTLDPVKDPIALRNTSGTFEFAIAPQAIAVSIQEAIPQISAIDSLFFQKIGKSNYLLARGNNTYLPGSKLSLAILLVETGNGMFQTDDLVISCSSAGECRECSLPPVCTCNKGSGSCGQNSTFITALKKVTVTIFD